MENGYMTPAELAAMKAQMEQQYADNVALNNQLSTVSNMTKNVSPLGNLGIMLGTLGGKWAAQRYNDVNFKNNLKIFDQIGRRIPGLTLEESMFANKVLNQGSPTFENSLPTTNNPAPSTALFAENNNWQKAYGLKAQENPFEKYSSSNTTNTTPSWDWRNQNYFSNVTRPPYFSIQ